MKKLWDTIDELGHEIVRFTQELEDKYDSPDLSKKLQYFRKRIKECSSYVPENTGGNAAEKDALAGTLYGIQLAFQEALDQLNSVTAKSNVFDIIDVLKAVYMAITRCHPGHEYDPSDFDDPENQMEADRISALLSMPDKDEWD